MKKKEGDVAKAKKSAKKAVKKAPKKAAKMAPKTKPAKKAAKKTLPKKTKTNAKRKSKASAQVPANSKVKSKANSRVKSKVNRATSAVSFGNFVTPLDDRVLIRVEAAARKTAGGLFIPDSVTTDQAQYEGVVVAVGRGHRGAKGKVRPMDVKVGNRVLFPQYAGSKIQLKGEELVIVRESELMGIVD